MSAFRVTKKATGLTGLVVSNNPQHTLSVIYAKTLRVLQRMPHEAAYRKHTEDLILNRALIVKMATSTDEIEKKIDCGQVEEIIVQAENELSLARTLVSCKPWEPLVTKPPQDQWSWPPTK